jgi:hypothetical protein
LPRKKKAKPIYDVKDAEKALGDERIEEIVDKEWKTAELPSEEELKKEKHTSPKARNNPNSRANLVQYKKNKPKEVKEKIVKGLRFTSKRPDKDLKAFFGDLLNDSMINTLINMREALEDGEEEEVFFSTVKQFLDDFPKGELSFSDLDDVSNLALNRVLELRILKLAKKSPKMVLDAAATIERFRKNSDKLKMNLASRRMDRIDTKNKQSFSIVDLAVAFDEKRKRELEERERVLIEKRKKFLNERENKAGELDEDSGD